MADREELLRLAERCEAATEPDFWLDRAICNLIRPKDAVGFAQPDYTDSIDEAASLVPEGWEWAAGVEDGKAFAHVHPRDEYAGMVDAATPALALAAASLRARAQDPLQAHGGGE